MKTKHNKKRNTAFVYEALIKEATVSIMKGDAERKNKVVGVIKKHFANGTVLKADLECYRALYENQNIDKSTSEKIVKEAKMQKMMIDPTGLFAAQTEMIHDVNKEIDSNVFGNFVPNYKTLATIDQIFNLKIDPKSRVILENEIIEKMTLNSQKEEATNEVDGLLLKTFVEKFNNKYSGTLLAEQQELLSRYIASFADNSLSLKMYLNDEIARLKEAVSAAQDNDIFTNDADMSNKAQQILERLESFATEEISEHVLLTVLKTQKLVEEINSDGDNG
tara:strand:+ start:216 stop:1049 length:834 start_codon:yes stop_codon:yes gene_type:complete